MNNTYSPPGSSGTSPTENAGVGVKSGNVVDLPAVQASAPGNTSEAPCDVCRSTGLVILPVRYTVVSAKCPGAGLGPFPQGRGCTVDVAPAGMAYGIRTLRKGMLYLYYEKGPYGPRQWEAYAIAENGTLWRQPSAYSARQIAGGGLPACSRNSHDPLRTEYITIQRPQLCGTVWIAYSQDEWTPAILDRYADDSALRAERMQPIEPSQWINQPVAAKGAVPASEADALKSVLEYRGFAGVISEPAEFPNLARPAEISKPDGSFHANVLSATSTRYCWALRNQATAGTGPDAALQKRYAAMLTHSHNGAQGDGRKTYVPMMLALWDAIGVVHELNGVRHDVIGCMARYKDERAFELNAMEHIDEISTLLQNNAAVLADQYAQASRDRLKEIQEANQGSTNPLVQSGLQSMSEAGLDSDNDATWDSLSKAMLPSYQRQAREQWEKKYWPLIDEKKYRAFKGNAQAFAEAALAQLKPRSQVLGKWLADALFLATLEDYDGTSPLSGVRFEDVVTEAIEGLGMDENGRQLLTQLSDNLDVTSRSCLLWRVVAQNQDDAREELKKALADADSQKDSLLEGLGAAGWSAFVSASSNLKKFLGYYKKFETVQKEAVPSTATNRLLRDTGVDRFVTTAGAFMLNRFPLNGIQDKVGNAIVRQIFCIRALMSAEEASDLIELEARKGAETRAYLLQRVKYYRAQRLTEGSPMMYALRDVERYQGRALMLERWKAVAESSRNAARLTSLTGVLELVNFINLLSKADKQASDYGSLVASGAAMVAVYTSVAETVNKDFFGTASRSVGRMKAVGGWLGGFATFVGAYYDFGSFAMSKNKHNYGMAVLYFVKGTAGGVVGLSQFLTALAYSAPLVQKTLGRNGLVIFLDGLRNGLQAAVASEAEQVLASDAMKRAGLWIIRISGWELALAITTIQCFVWIISPNELEVWCERNYFGKISQGKWFGFGESKSHYEKLKEQDEAFSGAIGKVTVLN